jgi:hypothetical protein
VSFPAPGRRAFAAAALLALAAGCARDRPDADAAGEAPAAHTETAGEVRQPEPEQTRVLRERLREESRAALPDDAPPPQPLPPATPAVGSYEECMRQAALASDPEERRLLEEPCPMLPGAPR